MYRVKKVLFLGPIFEIEFWLLGHVLRSPESETSGFERLVCLCVCYQPHSKTNNSRKTQLGLLDRQDEGRLLERSFCKDRTPSPYTGRHKRIQIHDGLCLVSPFEQAYTALSRVQ